VDRKSLVATPGASCVVRRLVHEAILHHFIRITWCKEIATSGARSPEPDSSCDHGETSPCAGAHRDHGPFRPTCLGAARHAASDHRGHRRIRSGRRHLRAGRAEKDPDLVEQLERAGALLDALGLATLTPTGLEADDVNASGATWPRRNNWNCVIITSDRDAFAHVSDHTQVLRLIDGGINDLEYAALRGDASDSLPAARELGADHGGESGG